MQVLPIKRPNCCGIGARYCDTLCAARMTQFLYVLSCSLGLGVAAVERNCACASCASWCGDTCGLCAQQWFGLGDECTRLSFERRGGVLWTHPAASVGTSVANCCHLRTGCCPTVCMGWCKTRGKVHRSFEIHSAWSVCSAVRTVLCKDAHHLHAAADSGCNENVRRVRTSKLRPCPGCSGSHSILPTLG